MAESVGALRDVSAEKTREQKLGFLRENMGSFVADIYVPNEISEEGFSFCQGVYFNRGKILSKGMDVLIGLEGMLSNKCACYVFCTQAKEVDKKRGVAVILGNIIDANYELSKNRKKFIHEIMEDLLHYDACYWKEFAAEEGCDDFARKCYDLDKYSKFIQFYPESDAKNGAVDPVNFLYEAMRCYLKYEQEKEQNQGQTVADDQQQL